MPILNSPLVFICIIGIVFSVMLLIFNDGYKSANRFLAGVSFFWSLYYLNIYVYFFEKYLPIIAVSITVIPSFFYLIGPLSYFYVRGIVKDNTRLSRVDLLHFTLFILSFAGALPVMFSSWDHKLQIAENIQSNNWFDSTYQINAIFSQQVNRIIRPIQLLVYVLLNWHTIYQYRFKLKQRILYTKQYKIIRNWLIMFCTILSWGGIVLISSFYNMMVYQNKEVYLEHTYVHLLLISCSYLFLNLVLLFTPQIMYGLPLERTITSDNLKPEESEKANFSLTHTKSDVSNTDAALYSADYIDKIEKSTHKIEVTALLTSPQFDIEQLSHISDIPVHHLSYYFNTILGVKFVEWRNTQRIEIAVKLIDAGKLDLHTFDGLMYQCGFTSYSTFIRAFKKSTGKTPSEFYKTMLND
jgi:AraC-like DNA-binding protein